MTPTLIAIPVSDGRLDPHFGHCGGFALIRRVGSDWERTDVAPPAHEPGVLPRWLAAQGVQVVIAGGMGERARQLLVAAGIRVILGAASATPEELVDGFLAGALTDAGSACQHPHGSCQQG